MRRLLLALVLLALPAFAARTAIATKTPTRTGSLWTWTAADAVNGNSCVWSPVTMLLVRNTNGAPATVTLRAGGLTKDDGDMQPPDRVATLPATSQGVIIVSDYYLQQDGTIWIDAPAGVDLACFTK